MKDSKESKTNELHGGTTKSNKFHIGVLLGCVVSFVAGVFIAPICYEYFSKEKVVSEAEGALPGWFSIDEKTQVCFAKGNLQYNAALNEWRFAENQYDFVGKDNEKISSVYDGWIDLFGWGTSGWDCGSPYYRPYDTVLDPHYGPSENGLGGEYANSDWGCFNSITNGGNEPDLWYTLDGNKWNYLLFDRSGMTFTLGIVHDVKGMLLFPDEWENPDGMDIVESNSCADNVFTDKQWTILESKGVVFLPMAGSRRGSHYNENDSLGFAGYWTSSMGIEMNDISDSDTLTYRLGTPIIITEHQDLPLLSPFIPRNIGASVRLVSRWGKVKK